MFRDLRLRTGSEFEPPARQTSPLPSPSPPEHLGHFRPLRPVSLAGPMIQFTNGRTAVTMDSGGFALPCPAASWCDSLQGASMQFFDQGIGKSQRGDRLQGIPVGGAVLAIVAVIMAMSWLAGCTGEVAGTSAAVGKLQADQAKQAKQQQDKIVDQLKAVQDLGAARAASATE